MAKTVPTRTGELSTHQLASLCAHIRSIAQTHRPLAILPEQFAGNDPLLHQAAQSIAARVEAGEKLSETLASQAKTKGYEIRGVIEAGLLGDSLPEALKVWSESERAESTDKFRLVRAVLYPALLIVVMLGSLGLTISTLAVSYTSFYESLHRPVPFWLSSTNWWLERPWLLGATTICVLLPGLVWLFFKYAGGDNSVLFRSVGKLRRESLMSILAASMIQKGVPTQEIVRSLLGILHSDVSEDLVRERLSQTTNGKTIAEFGPQLSALLSIACTGKQSAEQSASALQANSLWLNQRSQSESKSYIASIPVIATVAIGLITLVTYVLFAFVPWVQLMQDIVAV